MARPCPVLLLGLLLVGAAWAAEPLVDCNASTSNWHRGGTGNEACTDVFYQCAHNKWVRKTCAPGTLWDTSIDHCNHASAVTCSQVGTNACSTNPCQNGGTCASTATGYFCTCASGFTGENCESTDNCALLNPCQNGQCFFDQSYRCECYDGWTGLTCNQQVTNFCLNNPCQNGGICSTTATGYVCQCPTDFTGATCSQPVAVNYCQFAPCQNGGICSSTASGFTCQCQAGWTGPTCSSAITTTGCSSNPCQNGGQCSPQGSSFTCTCPSPLYYGATCSEYNLCQIPGICLNGGTCVTTGNATYTCVCPTGYSGNYCELTVATTTTTPAPPNYCLNNPCQNSGLCSSTATGYVCQCQGAWTGPTCSCPLYPCPASSLFYLYPDFSSTAHFYACLQGTLTRYACQDRIAGTNTYDRLTLNCVTK